MENKASEQMTNKQTEALLEAIKVIVEDNDKDEAIRRIERIQDKLKGDTRPDKAE